MSNDAVVFVQNLLRIRPEEARRTGLAFLYLFSAIGAFIVSRIARSVLFLELPNYREQLPLAYVATAVSVSLTMYAYARVERTWRRDQTNVVTLTALIWITLAFRWALATPSHAVYWAFYVWVEILGSFTIVQFWSFAGEIFNSRQAKRLFAIIGGGGVVANVIVGFAISGSVKALGTENLLYVITGFLAVSLISVAALGRDAAIELTAAHVRKPSPPTRAGTLRPPQGVFSTRHVQLVATVVVVTYIVSTLVDYQFQVIVGDFIPGKDDRSAFFGAFFGVTGILAAGIQFFLTARILERFGVLVALSLLPLTMLSGSLSLAVVPAALALGAVTFTKGSENVLRYTINDSTMQLLYLPLPVHLRGRAKAFIDGMLKPIAVGTAGILLALLVGQLEKLLHVDVGFHLGIADLSWATAIGLVIWMGALFGLKREYLKTLVQTLQRRRLNFADASFRIQDEGTVRILVRALDGEEIGEILHALELLPFVAKKGRGELDLKVAQLLRHEAGDVRVAALRYLRDAAPAATTEDVARLLEDDAGDVRAAAVLTLCAIAHEQAIEQVHPLLDDNDAQVRAAAVAGLIRYGGLDGVLAAAEKLKSMLQSPEAAARRQAAWVLGEVGVQHFYQPLVPLLADDSPSVRLVAIEAAGRLGSPKLVDPLVSQLSQPRLCGAAVTALAAYPIEIETRLATLLDDRTTGATVRSQICRVLGRRAGARAVETLVVHLDDPERQVRHAVTAALVAIVHKNPGTRLDARIITDSVRRSAIEVTALIAMACDLRLDGDTLLLRDALEHRTTQSQTQMVTLLGLKYPLETIELVRQNLMSAHPATRANAVEVLDNLLSKDEKAFIIPLVEDTTAERKLTAVGEMLEVSRTSRDGRLRELLASDDAWLQMCAAMACASMGAKTMIQEVRALLEAQYPVCRETAIVALRQLGDGRNLKRDIARLAEDASPAIRRYAQHLVAQAS